jgi:hypothetical protein
MRRNLIGATIATGVVALGPACSASGALQPGVIVLPQSGSVVMINTALGTGPWQEIGTPFVIDPTGGYGPGETHCPGYSSPVLPAAIPSDASFVFMASTRAPNGKCQVRYGTGPLRKATRSKL